MKTRQIFASKVPDVREPWIAGHGYDLAMEVVFADEAHGSRV